MHTSVHMVVEVERRNLAVTSWNTARSEVVREVLLNLAGRDRNDQVVRRNSGPTGVQRGYPRATAPWAAMPGAVRAFAWETDTPVTASWVGR